MSTPKKRFSFLRYIIAVWDYFRPSWEDNKGKFSYKRASQFAFLFLMILMAVRGVTGPWEFNTFLTIAILFSVTATVITIPELILMLKYYSQSRKFNYWNSDYNNDETTEDQNSELIQTNDKENNRKDSIGTDPSAEYSSRELLDTSKQGNESPASFIQSNRA